MEKVFTTFDIRDEGKLTHKEVLEVARDHFLDIADTFDLHHYVSLKQARVVKNPDGSSVYTFEILEPVKLQRGAH